MVSTIRRLAAILAADIAGYSRLMGADEVGTVKALREHRGAADPLIAQHGGRIVKTTGDGVLIEFGSVVGAVECALGLQRLAAERNASAFRRACGDISNKSNPSRAGCCRLATQSAASIPYTARA